MKKRKKFNKSFLKVKDRFPSYHTDIGCRPTDNRLEHAER